MTLIKKITGSALVLGCVAVIAADPAYRPNSTTKDTSKDQPGYVYFEEDWIAVPASPESNLVVVDFEKGGAALTSEQKHKLESTIASLHKVGPVKEAYVAVYADQLRIGNKDLPGVDQKLVRRREKAIRNFLEDDFNVDTVTFNMAARPGWWARLWNTNKEKVQGTRPTRRNWIADLLRSHDKASSAAVVFTLRNNQGLAE